MSLRAEIFLRERQHREADAEQRAELKKRILALPDNPAFKRVGKNAFVGSFSALGGNWSVEHHNFRVQYEILANIVDRAASAFSAMRQIRQAKAKGSVQVGTGESRYTVKLHPSVIKALKEVFA